MKSNFQFADLSSRDSYEPADYTSREGAQALKAKIESYWAERGMNVMLALQNVGFHPAIRAARSARIIACAAARSEGSGSEVIVTPKLNQIGVMAYRVTHPLSQLVAAIPPPAAATSVAASASRYLPADSPAVPA